MVYFLNTKAKAVVNGDNGEIIYPQCYNDLSQYHSYLLDRGHATLAQSILKQIFEGEKFISKMINLSQSHHKKQK